MAQEYCQQEYICCLPAVQLLQRLAKKQILILYGNLYRSAQQHCLGVVIRDRRHSPILKQFWELSPIRSLCRHSKDRESSAISPSIQQSRPCLTGLELSLCGMICCCVLWVTGPFSQLTLPRIPVDLGNRFCAKGYSKFYSLARLFQPGFLSSYYLAISLSSVQFAFSSCLISQKEIDESALIGVGVS